jgi:hypothetical protein
MGLERHFQIVRRLLEIDHEAYMPKELAWPRPDDRIRPLGFLEQRTNNLTLGSLPRFHRSE